MLYRKAILIGKYLFVSNLDILVNMILRNFNVGKIKKISKVSLFVNLLFVNVNEIVYLNNIE